MTQAKVLLVGGGPTGLIFALSLCKQDIAFRWIDASAGPGLHSRALGVHARTLELYRSFGISDQVVADGIHTLNAKIRVATKNGPLQIAELPFSTIGTGMSKFPFILNYPQDYHEQLLTEHLAKLGIQCERSTRLISMQEVAEGVQTVISGPNGEEKSTFKYIIGADGAHSKVRHSVNVQFQGGSYTQPFFVADVKLVDDFSKEFLVTLSASTAVIRLPVRHGQTRLIGLVPKEVQNKPDLQFSDVQQQAESLLSTKVASVAWFSYYTVHHRVAEKYSIGRTFLLGDAAHLHSPMGGQGMNTGIGDAINLAWKLGYVIKGRASEEILQTYDEERRPFGEKLVKTTDRAFGIVMQDNIFGRLIRRFLWPAIMFVITRLSFARRNAFRFMSQIHISYAHSKFSEGRVGSIQAGQRLPWIDYENGHDNFETFDGINWQLHIYGNATIDLQELDWIQVYRGPFDKYAKKAGFTKDSVFLMRPDTYSALAMKSFDIQKLRAYTDRWQLKA